jgi:hypothetical protein
MTQLSVTGNGTPAQGAGWHGNEWWMFTTDEFPAGDPRAVCQRKNNMMFKIPKNIIVSGPTQDGICTNGFGPNYKVTFNVGTGSIKDFLFAVETVAPGDDLSPVQT